MIYKQRTGIRPYIGILLPEICEFSLEFIPYTCTVLVGQIVQ